MQRAAGAVPFQAGQAETFRHHALTGKGCIAVQQQWQHRPAVHAALAVRHAELVLLGSRLAEHDGVDDLQMRRIGGQRQVHIVAVEFAVGGSAEMVFDVAGAFHFVRREGATLEFVEDRPVRLAHHLGQHIEPAAMGHAEHDFPHAQRAAALDDLLQRRDQRFAAVQTEALGAGIFDVEELLEPLRLNQLVEDRLLAFVGEGDFLVRPLDALLDPAFFGRIGNVHELHAQRRAIGSPQDFQHLRYGGEVQPQHHVEEDAAVVVGLREAVGMRVQFLVVAQRRNAERVEVGMQVAAHAIGADHHDGADRIARRAEQFVAAQIDAAGLRPGLDFFADVALHLQPVAVEGGNQLAVDRDRPARLPPGRAARLAQHVGPVVLQVLEKGLPAGLHRRRVFLVAGVKLFEIGGIAAVKEGGALEGFIRLLPCHRTPRSCPQPRASSKAAPAPRAGPASTHLAAGKGPSGRIRASTFQNLNQSPAQFCRRWRNCDAGRLHCRNLVFRAALAAGDDRPGMAHAPARRRRAPGDEADGRLGPAAPGFIGQELRRVLLRRTADFADHDDRLRRRIGQEQFQDIDEFRALDRVATDADGRRLAEAFLAGLIDCLIGKRARSRDNPD